MELIKKGFTLIELLVSLSVLVIVVVASGGLFFTSLKGKRKSESITILKQSAEYTLSYMTPMIRNAESVTNCSSTTIEIVDNNGTAVIFTCNAAAQGVGGTITINDGTGDNNLISDFVKSCNFNCDTTNTPNVVTIGFTLQKGTTSDIVGYAIQDFVTTISLRNY